MASSDEGGAQAPGEGKAQAQTKTRYCAVYDCTHNHKTHPHLAYFGFPKDKKKIKIWAERIRRPDIVQPCGKVSSYYRVCEQHFTPNQISRNLKRRRLIKSAVPVRNLPHPGPYVRVADVAVPATLQIRGKTLVRSTLEVCEYVSEVPKPKSRKKKEVVRPSPLGAPPVHEGDFSHYDQKLAPITAEFVNLVAQVQAARDNDMCVRFLHSSPQAYRLLQASLGLPTVSALHRHCAMHLTDFKATINLLITRVNRMADIEKHCTLSVDFIDVRRFLYYNITFDRIVGLQEVDGVQKPCMATRGVVVTARGLLSSWTQAIALCYLGRNDEPLSAWIETIIGSLHSIGLQVHALVWDPTRPPPFRHVSPDQPFFFTGDTKTKIYLMYDPPRLMKHLLCELMAYDFYFDKGSAKFSDVLDYRKIERNKVLTLTPGLTDSNIKPDKVQGMKPRRAARVLSRELATALTARADQGLLGDSARATASFIIRLNNLYDLLDSTTIKASSEFKKGLSQDPNQVGFLTYMKLLFKTLKLECSFGVKKALAKKLADRWRVTIEAVLSLQKDIQPLRPYLLTRNLHLEDSVAERTRCGELKPTCQQIFTSFRKQFCHDIQQSSPSSVNLNVLLAGVVSDAVSNTRTDPMELTNGIPVRASDYRRLRLDSLKSTAKHLLRAASRVHSDCRQAVEYVHAPVQPDFLQLVRNLDEALTSALRDTVNAAGFLRELLLDVHVLDCALPCECFPLDYLKRLFFRTRLYSLLRHNRKQFRRGEVDMEITTLE